MSKRNMIWLGLIVIVGAVVWIAAGFLWGLLSAAAVLVASEATERTRRRRIAAAEGREAPKPLQNVAKKRKQGR